MITSVAGTEFGADGKFFFASRIKGGGILAVQQEGRARAEKSSSWSRQVTPLRVFLADARVNG
jgi:hypothetical protein